MELGGYFSIKRNAVSMDGETFLTQDQVVPYCKALLEVYRCAGLWFHLPKFISGARAVTVATGVLWCGFVL